MEEEENNKDYYCICKQRWDDNPELNQRMVECDGKCEEEWFHPECIKMTKLEQNLINTEKHLTWLCKNCLV